MLEIIFIVSFMVLFIHVCTWEGMIFESIGKRLDKLPEFIKKPLFDCPICMSIWHGLLILSVGHFTGVWRLDRWFDWVIIPFAAGGVNTVLIYVIEQGKIINKILGEMDCNCVSKEEKKLQKEKERRERIKKMADKVIDKKNIL